jgi:hypothetical protein
MGTLHRFTTHLAAQGAVKALRAAGFKATVVGDLTVLGSGSTVNRAPLYDVVIDDTADHEAAGRVIEDFDANPMTADPGWEDTAAAPDLSRLDPTLEIPCPICSFDLRALAPPSGGDVTCPGCGGSVDLIRLILARHGPEALASCFPEPEDAIAAALTGSDAAVDAAPLCCSRCGYSLSGLPQVSHCPECGLAYSKRRMLRK